MGFRGEGQASLALIKLGYYHHSSRSDFGLRLGAREHALNLSRKSRRKNAPGRSRDGISEAILRSHQVEDQTHAESLYLNNLVRDKRRVVVKLLNNEEIEGWIEYYDKRFIRVTRNREANMFIYKHQIKYIRER